MLQILKLFFAVTPLFAQLNFSYVRTGFTEDVLTNGRGGTVLMGGGSDVREAFSWMLEQSGGGDFVVLRASGTEAYNPFVMALGKANSAGTLILRDRDLSSEERILDIIRKAEAIFLAGGDQANYVRMWKDTPLGALLNEKIQEGVPIGGTSAGLAVLGEFYFGAEDGTVTSAQALADWQGVKAETGSGFLTVPFLKGLITDSHFARRDRMGRLLAFLARMQCLQGVKRPRGLGIDEATAVLVDAQGLARVVGRGKAYFLEATEGAAACQAGKVLEMKAVKVRRLGAGESFDLREWAGSVSYELSVRAGVVASSQAGGAIY